VTGTFDQALELARVEYATWSQRFRAWLLDVVICGGVLLGVDVVVAVGLELLISPSDSGGWGEAVGAFSVFAFVLIFPAYLAFFHGGETGQTAGKRSMEISVRAASTQGRVMYLRALVRSYFLALFWALVLLSPLLGLRPLATVAGLVLLLDALWPVWDSRRQALHDKVAQTIVIRIPRVAGAGT
jgi:uncharacterized RDD family membrane protein YckC